LENDWLIWNQATRSGGKVLLVGIGPAVQTLPIAAAAQREVDLIGVFRYASTYKEGIEMIAGANEGGSLFGAVEGARSLPDVKKIITHRLQSVKEAFELVSSSRGTGNDLVIKVLVSGEA
jgi:L-iditol 2-dehydrogenase